MFKLLSFTVIFSILIFDELIIKSVEGELTYGTVINKYVEKVAKWYFEATKNVHKSKIIPIFEIIQITTDIEDAIRQYAIPYDIVAHAKILSANLTTDDEKSVIEILQDIYHKQRQLNDLSAHLNAMLRNDAGLETIISKKSIYDEWSKKEMNIHKIDKINKKVNDMRKKIEYCCTYFNEAIVNLKENKEKFIEETQLLIEKLNNPAKIMIIFKSYKTQQRVIKKYLVRCISYLNKYYTLRNDTIDIILDAECNSEENNDQQESTAEVRKELVTLELFK